MLLKKLHLHNFRQYKGDQEIEFSVDKERNVTIILGQNTSGKTTFVQAFRWVLYDDSNFTGKGKTSVMNEDVRRNMRANETEEAYVTLFLEHHDRDYEITRSLTYKAKISGDGRPDKNSILSVFYNKDGQRRPIDTSPYDAINGILPSDLSEYFFFDGEKIATSRKKQNVEASINSIMGLTPLKNLISHLNPDGRNSVISELKTRRVDDDGGKLSSLKFEYSSQQNKLKELKEKKESYENHIRILEDSVKDCYVEFAKVELIADDASKLKEKEKKIETVEMRMKEAGKTAMGSFGSTLYDLYLSLLSQKILDQLEEEDYSDKGIPEMTAVSIQYLLDRGVCICGSDLKTNPECKEKLIDLLNYLPPESIGSQIKQLSSSLHVFANINNPAFPAYYSAYIESAKSYDELDYEIKDLIRRIGDSRDADEIKKRYETTKEQLEREKRLHETVIGDIGAVEKKIEELDDQMNKISSEVNKNKDVDLQIEYAVEIYQRARNEYNQRSSYVLQTAKSTLVEVFNGMYHGSRTIELKDNYDVVLSVNGSELDTSKGLETVANFAFISTLLKIAKDNISSNPDIISSEPYPLVMDAVFSNTDEIHIANICNELPKLAEQAILAIMEKDWKHAESNLISKTGKMYRLNKISESYTQIEEVSLDV